MPTLTIKRPKLHEKQQQIRDSKARFVIARCGRRFGKSELSIDLIIDAVLRGKKTWWVALTHPNAMMVWDSFKRAFSPLGGYARISESERSIMFANGGMVAIKSADSDKNLRGVGLDLVALDEAAYMHQDIWYAIIRPMLMTSQGRAIFPSTPAGRNWFYNLYLQAIDDNTGEWEAFHFTSYDNPLIPRSEFDSLKRDLPERRFREEILAEFLDDGGDVFRYVRDAVYADTQVGSGQYVIGVDLGRSNDFTVFTVIDVVTHTVLEIDRFTDVEMTIQLSRLNVLYERYRPHAIVIETNFNSMFAEQAARLQLPVSPFTTTNATKQVIIDALALAFERREIRIPDNKILIAELEAFTVERLPSGTLRYGAPSGTHDDMVMSLALAWHGIRNPQEMHYYDENPFFS